MAAADSRGLPGRSSQVPITLLLGSPRSGTTLLGHLFAAHTDVWYSNEPRLVWRYGNDRRSDALQPAHARPEVVAHIRSHFAEALAMSGRSALVEKTPSNSLRVAFVDRVFPEAKFIHVVRDGREAVPAIYSKWVTKSRGVASTQQRARLARRLAESSPRQVVHYLPELAGRLRRRGTPPPWGPRLPGMSEMVRDLPLLEVCALQWRWSVESVLRDTSHMGDRIVTYKLEHLTSDDVRAMGRHAGLAGKGIDLMVEEFNGRFELEQTAGRFSTLSAPDQRRLETLLEPTLRLLDYA